MFVKDMEYDVKLDKDKNAIKYYFTDEMLNDGIFISVYQIKSAKGTPHEEKYVGEGLYQIDVISIDLHSKKTIKKVELFNVFSSTRLEPIENYAFLKSLNELHSSSDSKLEFLAYMEAMGLENEYNIYPNEMFEDDVNDEFSKKWAKEILAQYDYIQNNRMEKSS